ncbi:hypothetical protein V8C26DRAFT_403727 [Trichoderma gracile]
MVCCPLPWLLVTGVSCEPVPLRATVTDCGMEVPERGGGVSVRNELRIIMTRDEKRGRKCLKRRLKPFYLSTFAGRKSERHEGEVCE